MRLGLGQIEIVFEDKEKNRATCTEIIKKAKSQGVELLALPEMTLTGFSMHTSGIGEVFETSETVAFFRNAAKAAGMAILFGVVILEGGKAFNKAVLVDDAGAILCAYGKIHPFSGGHEAEFYTGGDSVCSVRYRDATISPYICYDLRFPEIFQIGSAESGLLMVISNWPAVRQKHIMPLLKARALENQSFAAFVNVTGFDGKLQYAGGSAIVDPAGDILFEAGEEEGLYVCDIDLSEVPRVREGFTLKRDRRPGLYARLFSRM